MVATRGLPAGGTVNNHHETSVIPPWLNDLRCPRTHTHKYTPHLPNDVDAVYEGGGVVPVGPEGDVEHCPVLGVVDLLAVEHGVDLFSGLNQN